MIVSEAQVGQALRIYPAGMVHIFADKVATVTRITKKGATVKVVMDGLTATMNLGPKVRCELIK